MRWISVAGVLIALALSPMASAEEQFPRLPPPTYSGAAIQGAVVDAETGVPLPGVIVVIRWPFNWATMGGYVHHSDVHLAEAVTAVDGTYAFSPWGPTPNPMLGDINQGYLCCVLDEDAPRLTLFKPAYMPQWHQNQYPQYESLRTSEWNGKAIRMEPFRGTEEEWARALHDTTGGLGWGYTFDWRSAPRITLALLDAGAKLSKRFYRDAPDGGTLKTTIEDVRRFVEGRP